MQGGGVRPAQLRLQEYMGDRMGYQPNRAGMDSENSVGILIRPDAEDWVLGMVSISIRGDIVLSPN